MAAFENTPIKLELFSNQDPFHALGHGQVRQKRANEAVLRFIAMSFPSSSPSSPVELIFTLTCISFFSPALVEGNFVVRGHQDIQI